MTIERHKGEIFPGVNQRRFAYEDEPCRPGCYIRGYLPRRENRQKARYREFEFIVVKHTDNSLIVTLRMHRNDIRTQRERCGAAVLVDIFQTILSFGELMNRIFGPGCEVYHDKEHFPEMIRDMMKTAYE